MYAYNFCRDAVLCYVSTKMLVGAALTIILHYL
jgi:hypothetical protein